MAAVSSFFPDAAPRAAAPAPPAFVAPPPRNPHVLPENPHVYETIKPISTSRTSGAGAEPLRFPASRSNLWDSTPTGSTQPLRPPTPRFPSLP